MAPDGSNVVRVTEDPGHDVEPTWAPDGSKIAFARNDRIYVMDADGANQRPLTDGDGYDSDPSWSPDGEWIAFEGTVGTGRSVFLIEANGTAELNLTGGPFDQEPDWQPITLGNVNCRSGVNSVDALLILQVDARLLESLECSDQADVNSDGSTNSRDAALVLQFSAGLVTSLGTP